MAIDQITLYNNALLLLGQRKLSSLTEDRAPRYDLDLVWDLGAADYCLEIVKPVFSRLTDKLTSSTTSTEHDLDNVFTLPSDYIAMVEVYSDALLDQPVSRYIIENDTLACNFDTVYVRYISNSRALSGWSASFARVVAAYLAREVCISIQPDRYEEIQSLFVDRVEIAKQLTEKEELERSSKPTVSLTNDWRHIYNDALMILGLDEITSNTDDSNRRSKIDRIIDAGVVEDLLEDTGWSFALKSTKMEYDPSVEPAWGYNYAFGEPTDLHRIDGVFQDEYMNHPLKHYRQEDSYFFADITEIYLQYLSSSWLTTPSDWPTFFKRMLAARIAQDVAPSLKEEGADPEYAMKIYEERKRSAEANDAMSSYPRMLAEGNWVKSRYNPYRRGNRGRP